MGVPVFRWSRRRRLLRPWGGLFSSGVVLVCGFVIEDQGPSEIVLYGASGFGESYDMKKEGGEDQNPQTAASLSVTFASVSPTSTPSVSSVDSPLSLFSRFCFEAFVATRWIRSAI